MKKQTIFSELWAFLLLWGSQAISTLGTAMTNFALIVWVYEQKGTASSITLLSACSFLPSVFFCFVAGTLADRWDKKRIMLVTDLVAALGTVAVLLLYLASALRIWHLYLINFLLSFMNAFQNPASYVATSLLVPKEHYVRVSGLYTLSRSSVTILAPALGGALLAFGGLEVVLLVDLVAFAIAFAVLLFLIKIPRIEQKAKTADFFAESCKAGIRFLREHTALLRIILFFAWVNFLSYLGGYGLLPALILGKTGNDQVALGLVKAAVGFGTLAGSILVTLMRPAKNRVRMIFFSCALAFLLGDFAQSLTHALPFWMLSALLSNVPVAVLGAHLTAMMRTHVPVEMHGRVFSARDTIQYSTIPIGLFLGGVLADHVFEPLMAIGSPLNALFGAGKGSGIAVIFFITGIMGFATSLISLKNPLYKSLDGEGVNDTP